MLVDGIGITVDVIGISGTCFTASLLGSSASAFTHPSRFTFSAPSGKWVVRPRPSRTGSVEAEEEVDVTGRTGLNASTRATGREAGGTEEGRNCGTDDVNAGAASAGPGLPMALDELPARRAARFCSDSAIRCACRGRDERNRSGRGEYGTDQVRRG
eukprot:8549562-Pyramimonas_sp.AAC.1